MAITSRGVKAKDALYLPAIRQMPDRRIRWEIPHILEFIFPHQIQPVYNSIAASFLAKLFRKANDGITGDDIASWLRESGFSKPTFYNHVLPRLVKLEMVERRPLDELHKRKMKVVLALGFSFYFRKIGFEWKSLVDTAGFGTREGESSSGNRDS